MQLAPASQAPSIKFPGSERRTIFPAKRSQERLSLKELRKLAGGLYHNAAGIVIRRFVERLDKDSAQRLV